MQVKKPTIIISLGVFAVVAIASGIILWKVLGDSNVGNDPSDAADDSCTEMPDGYYTEEGEDYPTYSAPSRSTLENPPSPNCPFGTHRMGCGTMGCESDAWCEGWDVDLDYTEQEWECDQKEEEDGGDSSNNVCVRLECPTGYELQDDGCTCLSIYTPPGACGETCGTGTTKCESGLFCNTATNKCKKSASSCPTGQRVTTDGCGCETIPPSSCGQVCSNGPVKCVTGLSCDTSTNYCKKVCDDGYKLSSDKCSCVPDTEIKASCGGSCASVSCNTGLTCDSVTKKCELSSCPTGKILSSTGCSCLTPSTPEIPEEPLPETSLSTPIKVGLVSGGMFLSLGFIVLNVPSIEKRKNMRKFV